MCVVLLCLGTESSTIQPLDTKKTHRELEVMKGILCTTMNFASKEVLGHSKSTTEQSASTGRARKAWPIVAGRGGDLQNIVAIYLANQGAVFTISVSQLRDALGLDRAFDTHGSAFVDLENMNFDYEEVNELVQEEMGDVGEQMRRAGEEMRRAGEAMRFAPPAPPKPPVPPAALVVPPGPLAVPVPDPANAPRYSKEQRMQDRQKSLAERKAEMQQRLAKLQAREREKIEQQEASQAKFETALSELKTFLVEALANHGDSMSIVKPNEYINLVLSDNSHSFWMGDADPARSPQEVISVQKSVVSDYKAGRITMAEFRQKVVSYRN
jgi:hypothetical protein